LEKTSPSYLIVNVGAPTPSAGPTPLWGKRGVSEKKRVLTESAVKEVTIQSLHPIP